jgi:hypothetical protein
MVSIAGGADTKDSADPVLLIVVFLCSIRRLAISFLYLLWAGFEHLFLDWAQYKLGKIEYSLDPSAE